MSTPEEKTIWEGTPAAAVDFWLNLSCLLILPIPWALVRWVQRRNHRIEITTERLRLRTGIFTRRNEELELYRVRDLTFEEPMVLRLFGAGTLILTTSDSTTPTLVLQGIPSDPALRDRLRAAVEQCRDRKRSRVTEWGSGPAPEDLHDGTHD